MVRAGWCDLAVKSKVQSAAGMRRTYVKALRRWCQQEQLYRGMGNNTWAFLWGSARHYR